MIFNISFLFFSITQLFLSQSFLTIHQSHIKIKEFKNNQLKNNELKNNEYKNNIINRQFCINTNSKVDIQNMNSKSLLHKIRNKVNNFGKLIRANNIIPTTLLCFSSGWISNPTSLYNLFHSKPFIISIVITLLIMSSSMIINDIVDIDVDKINNPDKPLINGSISKKESYIYLSILIFLTEILSYNYLPRTMQIITNLSILNIILYTPIFKKITFIKNVSCAFIIAFSVIFSSLGTNIYFNENTDLIKILFITIFYGSFYNEILLDIRDKDGDAQNKIYTVPVIYGNNFSINLLLYTTMIVSVVNTFFLYTIYKSKIVFFFPLFFIQLFNNLLLIKKNNYSKELIKISTKNTSISLFYLLLYKCILAKAKYINVF